MLGPSEEEMRVAEAAMSDLMTSLQAEVESRMLGRFFVRVPTPDGLAFRDNGTRRVLDPGKAVLKFLEQLLAGMEGDQIRFHFNQLLDLIGVVLARHCSANVRDLPVWPMRAAFGALLRTATRPCRCVRLVKTYRDALRVEWDFVLELAETIQGVDHILRCVSIERFREWDVSGSRMVMEDLNLNKQRGIVLLKYGFPYVYDRLYFDNRCDKIYFEGLRVNGNILRKERFSRVRGNLRLQMALEILLVLFNLREKSKRPFLRAVWRSVPHPFISSAEMRHLMTPFFRDCPDQLHELCEEYVKTNTVFSVPEVPEPRSLQDLARVQIRRNLVEARSIGDKAIDSLLIPPSLKSLLKLDT